MPNDGYYLRIDDLYIGGLREGDFVSPPNVQHYIGYLQNLRIGNFDIFDDLRNKVQITFPTEPKLPPLVFGDVTFPNYDVHVKLSPLDFSSALRIYFLFKTKDPNGVIVFNEGTKKEIFVVEIFNGKIYFKVRHYIILFYCVFNWSSLNVSEFYNLL